MNIFTFSKFSSLILIYGLFSVLCHATAIFFSAISSFESSSETLALKYAPMLEHSVMSLVLILIGVLLIEITIRETKK